jgi:orotate phosphoribosyltransferase
MKNLVFTIIALVSFSTMSSASTLSKELKKKELTVTFNEIEVETKTTCCTRRGKSTTNQSVVITACVQSTGDLAIDTGNACEKAAAIVKANIQLLDTLTP